MAGLLLVAACAATPPADVEIGLRNPTVTLAGTTRFDAARFAGEWRSVACLGHCDARVRYAVGPGGVLLREAGETRSAYRVSAPGVLREIDGDGVLVVMWVDEGFRTAALGDADGRWAAILDRGGGAADRTRAATEVLDFNGWDVTRLRRVEGWQERRQ
ncbi:lipocalin [Marimonas sp. MJW-29]|uniref:Lipocalin n=1 Tax=Sulfitobacter sediminis TaxID=3234186 RepID=A0ABV3RKC1_9RHOB